MDGKDENVDKLNALKEDIRKQLPEWSKKRGHIVSLLDYHLEQLNAIDPVLFLYMTEAQRKQKKEQLMLTLHLLSIKASLDIAENRTKTIKKLNEKMDQCSLYLNQLTILLDHTKQNTDPALDFALLSSDKYLKYLGLEIGAEVAKNIWQFVNLQGENASASNISTWIREQMTEVNNKRLYWVWGGGLVTSTLRLLLSEQVLAPENIEQALHALGHVSPITGYMSWVLYYARFGLSLSLLLKHTIAGPWMSKEEQAIPMSERLKTQLDQRIFSMLNDSIWATANLSCFFWLTGSGGDGVTIALLIMDLVLVSIAFRIEANKHNAEMLALEGHRKKLEDELEDDRHAINKKHKELVWLDEKFSALAKQQDEIEQQKKRGQ